MREQSVYLSEKFMDDIWPAFERTLKKKTRSNYFSSICMLCDYCRSDFVAIKHEQAAEYLEYTKSGLHRLSAKTRHARLSTFRSLAYFIEKNFWQDETLRSYRSPFDGIFLDAYSDDIETEKLPSETELERIMEMAESSDSQMYLILLFATKCALTSGELCSLTPKKIRMDAAAHGFITFYDKSGKNERIVKVPNQIMEYLQDHAEQYMNREYLFVNSRGTQMSTRTLQQRVSVLMEEAGMERSYTIQDLRNLSIAKMLYAGAEEGETAAYVGIAPGWIYRYSRIVPELRHAPCDLL
jgi:site-specific recombinase XerD